MTELILITLGITFGCNILAGLGSYLVLYTELLKPFRIQSRTYRKNVFWKRFPLIAFNLSTLFILAAIGLYIAFPLFDMSSDHPY